MEEYQNRKKYLYHLRKIAEIKHRQQKVCPLQVLINSAQEDHSRSSRMTSVKSNRMTSVKSSRLGSTNTTEKIMREFGQQKENCRLVNRIMNMSSSISMKKYMKDYLNHKSMMKIHVRARKSSEALCFRFFDIRFFHSVAQPDDIYRVYHVSNTKKKLLVEMTLFELRKTKLRIPKGQPAALKIQGKQEGVVHLSQANLLDILNGDTVVGNVVLEMLLE